MDQDWDWRKRNTAANGVLWGESMGGVVIVRPIKVLSAAVTMVSAFDGILARGPSVLALGVALDARDESDLGDVVQTVVDQAVAVEPSRQEGLPCGACGSASTTSERSVPEDYEYGIEAQRHFSFTTCADCGSERLQPVPSEEELLSFYPAGYHAYNDDHGFVAKLLVGLRARLRARSYGRLVGGQSAALYDVGAGDCRHFDELLRYHPFTCAGIEINPTMAERARSRGFDIDSGTLERADLARHYGKYDIVSMNHVLEHVIEPLEVVRRAFRLLRPGGHLVGQIPTNSSWESRVFGRYWAGYHFPRHLHVFSRRGLGELLRGVGFAEVAIRSTPHVQIPLSVQNAIVAKTRVHVQFGRAWFFGPLLLACLPLEVFQAVCGRSGVIDFQATRPMK